MTNGISFPLLGLMLAFGPGCGLVGPSCLAQQKRGTVTSLGGEVAARMVALHQVSYGSEGSQNDVNITWRGQFDAGGPRVRVYATRAECPEFMPTNAAPASGPCASIGSAGGIRAPDARPCAVNHTCDPEPGEFVQTSLIITNGRGNPDILGAPPDYKLWVVGDSSQNATYTMTITWFYGPDC